MLKSLLLSSGLALVLAASSFADTMTFITTPVEVLPADQIITVTVKITDFKDAVTNEQLGVKISATLNPAPNGAIGDITGLFFNIAGTAPGSVIISGVDSNDMTPPLLPTDITYSTTAPPFMTGGGLPSSWDMSFVPIGDLGAANWNIQFVMFTIGSTPVLDRLMFQEAGVRLQTVNLPGRDSLKLYAPSGSDVQEPEIPEPSTWLMFSAGLGLLALARRRRTA